MKTTKQERERLRIHGASTYQVQRLLDDADRCAELEAENTILRIIADAARNVMDLSKGGPLLLADALDDLDQYDRKAKK